MPSEIWSNLRFRLRALIDRAGLDREIDDELAFHLEHEAERHERAGLSHDQAVRRARAEFGPIGEVKEACRRARSRPEIRSHLKRLSGSAGRALTSVAALVFGVRSTVDRGISSPSYQNTIMRKPAGLQSSRAVGVVCAIAATGIGLGYMAAAGAPRIYLVVNLLALILGLTFFALVRPESSSEAAALPGAVMLAAGGALLATSLFGASVDGASRWVRVGGLSIQISIVLLPAMVVGFARRRDLPGTLGMVVAAVALALQPDRAMAGVLASALTVLALRRRDRWVASALAFAVAAFVVTLLRPDTLPAVPYVDQVLYTAFGVHPLAGLAVVAGALLLAVPALTGVRLGSASGDACAVFGVAWLGMVLAAALGNYPTPLVGYGGSAVLGYALSLAFLPGRAASRAAQPAAAEAASETPESGLDLRIAIA